MVTGLSDPGRVACVTSLKMYLLLHQEIYCATQILMSRFSWLRATDDPFYKTLLKGSRVVSGLQT